MKEKAVQFGKSATLTGIVTEPVISSAANDRPAFLLLNSGILHRVGSCRLHVRIARAIADAGFSSLRFDFSGIGDSEPRPDTLSFEESSQAEVREAMDYLSESRGISRFVLVGLCSGADMAHLTATQDERVCGLVFIDAWAYRTRRFWFHYYAQRLFKADVWRNWALVRVRRLRGELSARRVPAQASTGVEYEVPKYVRAYPPREHVAADLSGFMKRGVNILAIFTAGLTDHYNHRGQYRGAFPEVDFGDRLQVEFIPGSDHIITDLGDQAHVLKLVSGWAARLFVGRARDDSRITVESTPTPRESQPAGVTAPRSA